MRCEDFPCCGHYEASTGDIFCYEANRTPAQRKADAKRLEAERLIAEANAIDARTIEYNKSLDRDHDDERCENGLEMCEECYVEAENAEADYANERGFDRDHPDDY